MSSHPPDASSTKPIPTDLTNTTDGQGNGAATTAPPTSSAPSEHAQASIPPEWTGKFDVATERYANSSHSPDASSTKPILTDPTNTTDGQGNGAATTVPPTSSAPSEHAQASIPPEWTAKFDVATDTTAPPTSSAPSEHAQASIPPEWTAKFDVATDTTAPPTSSTPSEHAQASIPPEWTGKFNVVSPPANQANSSTTPSNQSLTTSTEIAQAIIKE